MTFLELMQKLLPRALAVVVMLAALELLFRYGAWELVVKPESNAGQAVRLKKAVNALGADKIDFITLGDSRAVYGIDHQRVADVAKAAGFQHANLALAGMHWLSTNAAAQWIAARDTKLKGALIATNVTNFAYVGNGAYELAIAAPLVPGWDAARFDRSVAFDKKDMATYGVYSALFQYREDVQNLLREPVRRVKEKAIYANQGAAPLTFAVKVATDACGVPMQTVAACANAAVKDSAARTIVNQCQSQLPNANRQLDWRAWREPGKVSHLQGVIDTRRQEIRALPVKKPVLVVLMPVPRLWREQIAPKGTEEYVLELMAPLVADGTIVLHDFTHFFDHADAGECSVFWDLYHQNSLGQSQLTDALIPILQRDLYGNGGKR